MPDDFILQTKDLTSNPWSKVYWFARMLLNTDQYASIGKDTERLLKVGTEITAILESNQDEPDQALISIIHTCIKKSFLNSCVISQTSPKALALGASLKTFFAIR